MSSGAAAIFDMDGVLVDTEPIYYDVNLGVFAHLGIDVPDEEHLSYVGLSSRSMWGEIKAKYRLKESVDDLVKLEQDEVYQRVSEMQESPVVAGAEDLIRELRDAGVAVAVASSSPHRAIDLLLKKAGLRQHFFVKVSGDDVKRSKPHPDIFLAAAERLSREPSRCLVIEDSPHGIRGAKAAGMKAVGFANPNSGDQDLSEADLVIAEFTPESIRAVLRLLK